VCPVNALNCTAGLLAQAVKPVPSTRFHAKKIPRPLALLCSGQWPPVSAGSASWLQACFPHIHGAPATHTRRIPSPALLHPPGLVHVVPPLPAGPATPPAEQVPHLPRPSLPSIRVCDSSTTKRSDPSRPIPSPRAPELAITQNFPPSFFSALIRTFFPILGFRNSAINPFHRFSSP
jgi:hypothetical protein